MNSNADYVASMQSRLKHWDAQVDALVAASKQANAFEAARYEMQLAQLRTTRDAAQVAFKQIRMASDEAGLPLQAGMESAWLAMQAQLVKTSTELRRS